jgi:hypothetical protein
MPRVARVVGLIWLALSVFALSGCASSDPIAQVRQSIISAGFEDAGVHVRHTQWVSASEDRVEVVLLGSSMNQNDAWEVAATEVWEELPVGFDALLVEYRGEVKVASYADLESQFGARPEGLNEQEVVGVLAGGVGRILGIVGAIGGIALVPILVLVRRLRHRRGKQDRTRRAASAGDA